MLPNSSNLRAQKVLIYQEIKLILKNFKWITSNKIKKISSATPSINKLIRSDLIFKIGHYLKICPSILHYLALSIELLHLATKMHDQVSNEPLVHHNEVCVLLGDYFYAMAFDKILALKNIQIVKALANQCQEMSDCEVQQLHLKKYALLFKAIGTSLVILSGDTENLHEYLADEVYKIGLKYLANKSVVIYEQQLAKLLITLHLPAQQKFPEHCVNTLDNPSHSHK